MNSFETWLRQPTTIHGIGVVAMVGSAVVAHFCGASDSVVAVTGGVGYALAHIGINETPASRSVEKLAEDVITAVVTKSVSPSLSLIVSDAKSAADAWTGAAALPLPITTIPPAGSTPATVTTPITTIGEQPHA